MLVSNPGSKAADLSEIRHVAQADPERELAERLGLSREDINDLLYRVLRKAGISTKGKQKRLITLQEASIQIIGPEPPKVAGFLLLLVPQKSRENLLGDLEEEFSTIVLPRYGLRKARFWYWWQVIASIMPFVWAQIKRVAGLVLLWKAVK